MNNRNHYFSVETLSIVNKTQI